MARSKAAGRAKKHPQNSKNAILCSVCGKGDGKYKCPKCRSPFCCVQCSKDHKAKYCPANPPNNSNDSDEIVSKPQAAAVGTISSNAAESQQSKYLPAAAFKQSSLRKKRVGRSDSDDDDDDQPGWNITPEMKQLIQRSDWLRKELQDGGLRHLIEQIDAASDEEEEDEHHLNGDESRSNNNKRRKKNWGMNGQSNMNGNIAVSPRELALARTKHSHPKFAAFMDRLLLTAGVLAESGGGDGGNGESNLFDVAGGLEARLELVPVPRRSGDVAADVAAVRGKLESQSNDGEEDSGSSDDDEENGSSDEVKDDDDESGNDSIS